MILGYIGAKEINGSLIALDDVEDVSLEEAVDIRLDNGTMRQGRIIQMDGKRVAIQVFDGTRGIPLGSIRTCLRGRLTEMPLSPETPGRVFDGSGWPIDGLGNIFPQKRININGIPINPMSRVYPVNYINTGISSIDTLMTLIRGQKLPIFSGSGMFHNEPTVQIARQVKIAGAEDDNLAIVSAATGVKNGAVEYLCRSFDESGVLQKVVMLVNLASDPTVECTLTPRCTLATAGYLAFELNMHILVIITNITSYAEALRGFSSSKGEVLGKKGFPGYLYPDFVSPHECVGMIEGRTGSATQIPILTVPNGDVTHPVSDLTGYTTEGQIVLDCMLDSTGICSPVGVLPSLSRLMKDGIGEGFTRADHFAFSNQPFASYAKVMDVRSLVPIIGEEELSPVDKQYLHSGKLLEQQFPTQRYNENRTIDQSLDLGWRLLPALSRPELDRVDDTVLSQFYKPETTVKDSDELDEETDGTTND